MGLCFFFFGNIALDLEKSYLGAENGRLNQLERAAVDLDETLAGLALSDSLFQIQTVSKTWSFWMSVSRGSRFFESAIGAFRRDQGVGRIRTVALRFLPKH